MKIDKAKGSYLIGRDIVVSFEQIVFKYNERFRR